MKTIRTATPPRPRYDLAIGIDPGTHTGVAIAEPEPEARGYRWREIDTLPLHRALLIVYDQIVQAYASPHHGRTLVVVEDARQIGGPAHQKLGAGSIRRDCAVWDELLTDLRTEVERLDVEFVRPSRRGLRKLSAEQLATYTGCTLKGSQHARDAVGVLFPFL